MRDELLALPVSDRDWVVTGAAPIDMQELGYRQVGKDFPVFLHPATHEEYALARTERKTSAGYHGFEFNTSSTVTLEQDLARRDLTINAIAKDEDGTLIDPWNGLRDIKERVLRHISPAFAEDPLRVLRVARFRARLAPLGFEIADETMDLMSQLSASGELETLAAERVFGEIRASLRYRNSEPFFDALRQCGALRVLLPEIDRLFGVPQVAEHHPEIDTGVHTMLALTQTSKLSESTATRFASLCHDLGKATTPAEILPSHHGHEERGAEIVEELANRLKIPTVFRDLAVLCARFHTHAHRAQELNPKTLLKLLMSMDCLRKPDRFEQYLRVCEGDARGRLGFENRSYPQADFLRAAADTLRSLNTGDIAREATHATGKAQSSVADAIRLARLDVIKHFVRSYSSQDKS